MIIIFEDFGGESLKSIISKQKLALKDFLKIGIKLTNILAQVHSLNIIHKNINPANIVLNFQIGELKLIDFGIATVLTSENTTIKNPKDDNIYKIVNLDLLERLEFKCEYKFAHDKIQQAAYFLIFEKDKPSVHWQIGELLLQNTSITGLEQKIFDVVNQINLGIKFINSQSQQINIANLNLRAAKKS